MQEDTQTETDKNEENKRERERERRLSAEISHVFIKVRDRKGERERLEAEEKRVEELMGFRRERQTPTNRREPCRYQEWRKNKRGDTSVVV